MKLKRLITVVLSSVLLFGGLGALKFSNETKVEEAEAATHNTHPENFDPYTYSGSYYNGISGTSTALRSALTTLIFPKDWYTYKGTSGECLAKILQSADQDPTNSSNMIYYYTRDSVKKNAADTWNREHCWPQSDSNDCWGTGKAGTDILHIRPTYSTTNSTRGKLENTKVFIGEKQVMVILNH